MFVVFSLFVFCSGVFVSCVFDFVLFFSIVVALFLFRGWWGVPTSIIIG